MKQKVYIETSVVSYLVARPSKNLVVAAPQTSTLDFWNRLDDYAVFISDIVIQEASKGDETQAKRRCEMLEPFQVLAIDELHIAVAAANGMDVIVTWNFKHINNPFIRQRIRRMLEEIGWICPEICSPEEFLGDEI
jgi:predicted nucleic acid-binding protein